MNSFLEQIKSDIKEYQENYKNISNIHKDEWAFNYWVLDKLFYEDEELIEEKIIDYHDLGVDAYQIYDDVKEIYLIQNKYYNERNKIRTDYVRDEFLIRAITALEDGTYKHSEELQGAFSKYKDSPEFTVYLQLFVTNNLKNEEAEEYIKEFNMNHPKYIAKIFYLDDIKERFFEETQEVKKKIIINVESVNKGTILNINTEDYKLENIIDARYVLTPVVSIYRLYKNALENSYPIFDKNIREYLGNKGINKNIYKTLLNKDDRKNFFYYNNGITVICDKMGKIETKKSNNNMNVKFQIHDPQIVNGCQTVNSIYEALKNINDENLEKEFKDTFVMMKILEINRDNNTDDQLYKDIVKYTNSQNSIDEKTFVANNNIFNRLQNEFEAKGFLLKIKQSDKNKFSSKYKTITKLKSLNEKYFEKFDLNDFKKLDDVLIDISKLLQVINAFVSGGHTAYVKKSNVLKYGSEEYKNGINFIKNDNITTETILELYLLYKKAEQEKKSKKDDRYPIPFYLIDCFAKYECKEREISLISSALDSKEKIEDIITLYTRVTKAYTRDYNKKFDIDYNKMIKKNIDYDIMDDVRDTYYEN